MECDVINFYCVDILLEISSTVRSLTFTSQIALDVKKKILPDFIDVVWTISHYFSKIKLEYLIYKHSPYVIFIQTTV